MGKIRSGNLMVSYKRRKHRKDIRRIKVRGRYPRSEPKCTSCPMGERSSKYSSHIWCNKHKHWMSIK